MTANHGGNWRELRGRCLIFGLVLVVALARQVPVQAADEFAWKIDEKAGTADLNIGDQPVVRYMFAYDFSTPEQRNETYKVFHHVFGPGTKTLITKGSGGEYPHHRGIYVGFNRTRYDGGYSDFWHCTEETKKEGASLKHIKFVETVGDGDRGTMTAEIHWINAKGEPVVAETRTLTVKKITIDAAPGYGWQIDVVSKLESRKGTIILDGDRQHAGLQFRAAQIVGKENSARYIRPAGFPEQEKAFEVEDAKQPSGHINLGWLAMSYPVEGQTYTVQYCEDPSLPKPSRYSERPYGRFGAFFKSELTPAKPLVMRYRLLITSGAVPARDVLQQRYDVFVKALNAP